MAAKQKIAFIRKGRWPLANVRTAKALQHVFPEYEVEEIDLIPLLRRDMRVVARNTLAILAEYGPDVALKRRSVKEAFLITSYLFGEIKQRVAEHLSAGSYVFSFQMQSLFDASVPNLPHFVYTDHTVLANRQYPGYHPRQLYHRDWMQLEPSIYHNATLVFTRSTNVSRSMIEDYGCNPASIKCVYAGSNTPQITQPAPPNQAASQNILFVGIDWERKGGPDLMAAFQQVQAVHPQATLTIIGCTPPISAPGVSVLGRVPVAELPQYYRQAAVFCLPTKREPFGIVVVEAMAYGLPVVTTNLGAMPDMVIPGENGALVEPGSVDQLASALLALLDDPATIRRYGARSREIAARYTWEAVGQRMRSEIMQVIGQELVLNR
jgi:glycosyltransferase involved in cell wall biosynthesis